MPKRPYPRHRPRHDMILVAMMENPRATQKDIAAVTGYTASQVSRIVNSPDFRARYDQMIFGAVADAKQIAMSRFARGLDDTYQGGV